MLDEIIQIDRSCGTPVYLQITHAIIQGIRQGKLRKGLRLPGARRLADLLDINRLTVAAAFNELELQGWVEIRPQKGAFVKIDLPMLSPKKLADEAAVFHLPEKPGFTYEERKILPYYSQEFPPVGKLVTPSDAQYTVPTDPGGPMPMLSKQREIRVVAHYAGHIAMRHKYADQYEDDGQDSPGPEEQPKR